jgi:hypothetical protein
MSHTVLKNLDLFKKLCGEHFYERVILTTTMWPPSSGPDYDECDAREMHLKSNYWVEAIVQGSQTRSFMNTLESAQEIINTIVEAKRKDKLRVEIQREMLEEHKSVPRTQAGKRLHGYTKEAVERQKSTLKLFKAELVGRGACDPADLEQLRILQEELVKAERDLRKFESRRWFF